MLRPRAPKASPADGRKTGDRPRKTKPRRIGVCPHRGLSPYTQRAPSTSMQLPLIIEASSDAR